MPCVDAIVAGDGREIFNWTPEGFLKSFMGSCLSLLDQGSVALAGCDGADAFEVNAADQLSAPTHGDACVVLAGDPGVGSMAGASVTASAAQASHAATSVLDENSGTYWAASFEGAPVELTVNLETSQPLDALVIDWEFAPRAFSVVVGSGGPTQKVYATSSNHLNRTSIPLHGVSGSVVRLIIQEPHPVLGAFGGASIVGVRSLRVFGDSWGLGVAPCEVAQGSANAGDKFFFVAVPEFDPKPAARVRDAAAVASATGNRLAGLLAELSTQSSVLDSCSLAQQRSCANCTRGSGGQSASELRGIVFAQSTRKSVLGERGAADESFLRILLGRARAIMADLKTKV
jgi:hypothetical protein